jgi:hypothetical protein
MDSAKVPERVTRTMIEMHGAAGQAWLDELPTGVTDYERRWAIQASFAAMAAMLLNEKLYEAFAGVTNGALDQRAPF